MKQKRFYSYALATSLLISSFGGLVNVSAATYQDAEEVKAQEHVSIMKMDASASDLFKFSTKSQSKWIPVYPQADGILEIVATAFLSLSYTDTFAPISKIPSACG